jgi:hypothetical protein
MKLRMKLWMQLASFILGWNYLLISSSDETKLHLSAIRSVPLASIFYNGQTCKS